MQETQSTVHLHVLCAAMPNIPSPSTLFSFPLALSTALVYTIQATKWAYFPLVLLYCVFLIIKSFGLVLLLQDNSLSRE